MAKKQYGPQENKWAGVPRRLPLKYHPKAVIPAKLVDCDTGPWEYLLEDGVRVKFQYRRTCNNDDGWADASWDATCRELYNLSFEQVKAVWTRRLGRLDGWWHTVLMIKVGGNGAIE